MDKTATKILICMGTSGVSAGAEKVYSNFVRQMEQHTCGDRYELVKVGDRGLFRDVLVDIIPPQGDRITYEYVKPEDVAEIVESHLVRNEPVKRLKTGQDYESFFAHQMRIVLSNCGEIDPQNIDDYIAGGGYAALQKTFGMDAGQIIDEVERSGLRGRGGAGFSTGLKWRFCKDAPGDEKYVVCNADEGDPGAFMDRSLLEGDPHAVLEGMIIASYAIGAQHGYIYCRAEYPLAIKILHNAIAQAKEKGYLGKNILGTRFCFDLTVKEGAGAFVCGEETALIASIEGRRGNPIPRPPYPANSGVWQKPTLINNVETYANVRHIISRGAEWYASIGTEKSKGTKVFALAGKVKNTGLVEIPFGTTIKEVIDGPAGGGTQKKIGIKAVQLGGPSGGCIPSELFDTPIDYETITQTGSIIGSGGMVVMDQKTCMVDIAKYFLNFNVEESCGKCIPCRVGLKRLLEILEDITQGNGKKEHISFLESMGETIKSTALCALGNSAPNPVLTTLKFFFAEYQAHINEHVCPSHVCAPLIKFEVMEESCVKCGQCRKACPAGAVEWKKGTYAQIDKEKCIRCKSCINACQFMAIQ